MAMTRLPILFQTSIEYFDNLGTSRQLTVEYIPQPSTDPAVLRSNEWTMTIYDNAQPMYYPSCYP